MSYVHILTFSVMIFQVFKTEESSLQRKQMVLSMRYKVYIIKQILLSHW